jgi:hypothetical protein
MSHRVLPLLLVALALACFLALPASAADKNNTHDGTVVKAGDGKLTMTGKDGKEHSHNVAKDAKVTINGKPGKLDDLKEGMMITVTTDDNNNVTAVDAKSGKEK